MDCGSKTADVEDPGEDPVDSPSVTASMDPAGGMQLKEPVINESDSNLSDSILKNETLAIEGALLSPGPFPNDDSNISKVTINFGEDTTENTEFILNETDYINLPNTTSDKCELNTVIKSSSTDPSNGSKDINCSNDSVISECKTEEINNLNSNLKIQQTISTNSLNNQDCSLESLSLCKSSYSRSAENISTVNTHNNFQNYVLNSSTKELNTEKILEEFSYQKPKVVATQKITEATQKTDNNLDVRYTRIPKDILHQDIGSIVKNVHGIFSSVSGSLKNAYNSQRVVQKPIQRTVKSIPNGKVMNEIFEDEHVEPIEENNENKWRPKTEPKPEPGLVESMLISTDTRSDVLKLQIETLERVLAEQRKENATLRERVKQQIDELHDKDQAFKEFEAKMDSMTKRVETAERDKDAAVMRYASVECAAIEAKRAADKASAAEKAALVETDLMSSKLKSAHAEKHRICQLYDDKCHELSNSERELAKVREEVKELEGRLKWTQSKLRMEMDAYKDSSERVEKLQARVSELEGTKETNAAHAADAARIKQLESELAESQAALILCRHERDALERRLTTVERQLKDTERAREVNAERADSACAEVALLRAANLRLEQEAAELAALRAQAALADTLTLQLNRESERALLAEETANKERARADTCARREARALEHNALVTNLQAAAAAAATTNAHKAQALEVDNESLRARALALESEREALAASLREESDRRARESKVLARKVAELTEEVNETNKKLEWEKGENDVLRKKHANAIKELNRELLRALKRCEQMEAKLAPPDEHSTRTESISSLSSAESAYEESRQQNGHDVLPDIQVREPDRQSLIERIVSLQRAAARRAERCDFLEEHSRQLTSELRTKSRLLRNLLCALPAGAVASHDSDNHKKEIARLGGGAMAALWGGDPNGMTLELSLEMNKRLQAVLEDALLKNITLKENMDTLGEEIARLKAPKTTTDTK